MLVIESGKIEFLDRVMDHLLVSKREYHKYASKIHSVYQHRVGMEREKS